MKGTPDMPRCGFSMRVVQTLDALDAQYGAIGDPAGAAATLREVTTELSNWQTFPQLYVKGELVGGAGIVEEMFESGELAELLGLEQPAAALRGRGRPGASRRSRLLCRSNSASQVRRGCKDPLSGSYCNLGEGRPR